MGLRYDSPTEMKMSHKVWFPSYFIEYRYFSTQIVLRAVYHNIEEKVIILKNNDTIVIVSKNTRHMLLEVVFPNVMVLRGASHKNEATPFMFFSRK